MYLWGWVHLISAIVIVIDLLISTAVIAAELSSTRAPQYVQMKHRFTSPRLTRANAFTGLATREAGTMLSSSDSAPSSSHNAPALAADALPCSFRKARDDILHHRLRRIWYTQWEAASSRNREYRVSRSYSRLSAFVFPNLRQKFKKLKKVAFFDATSLLSLIMTRPDLLAPFYCHNNIGV